MSLRCHTGTDFSTGSGRGLYSSATKTAPGAPVQQEYLDNGREPDLSYFLMVESKSDVSISQGSRWEWINFGENRRWAGGEKKRARKEMKSVVEIRLLAPLFPGFEVCAETRKGSARSNGHGARPFFSGFSGFSGVRSSLH